MGGLPNAVSSSLTQAIAAWTPNGLTNGNLVLVYIVNMVFGVLGCCRYGLLCLSRPAVRETVKSTKLELEEGCQTPENENPELEVNCPSVLLGSPRQNGKSLARPAEKQQAFDTQHQLAGSKDVTVVRHGTFAL